MSACRRLAPIAALLAFALAGPAFAGDGANPGRDREQFCRDNPAKCEEKKARREEFCKNNPATCEHRERERAEHKQWCQDNPAECDQLKAERMARRDKIRERCEANPQECEKRREQFRERRRQRSEAFCAEHPDKCDGV